MRRGRNGAARPAGKRAVSFTAALALALLCAGPWGPAAGAVTQADIDTKRGEIAGLDAQIGALEDSLAQAGADRTRALEQKQYLDEQIVLIDRQVEALDAVIADYDGAIAAKEGEVEELTAREEAQYRLFCQRVRSMEEQGTSSYLSILFRASSFAELLDDVVLIGEIMDYDNDVIAQLQATRREMERARGELEIQRAEQRTALEEREQARVQMEGKRTQAEALVAELLDRENGYRDALAQIEAEEARAQAELVRLAKEYEEEQRRIREQEERSDPPAAPGGWIWPVDSRKITSGFGGRDTGIPGASTDHKGIDIGGVGYTSQVRAAQAGTVIVSKRSSSYGEYVVVSHGSGVTSLYAHMSSRKVSVGDVVAQGDVLGITGATGVSRGPHLHFEISVDGTRVDPRGYLPA